MAELPVISVIIPCRNEEQFISGCLDSLLANDYPREKMELLVMLATSNDRTEDIVRKYESENPVIRVCTNPGKTFPCAVNLGISCSAGEFVFIAGAHAVYNSSYLRRCIERSFELNADNIGGILITVPIEDDLQGSLVTRVLSSPFGVGGSRFRTGEASDVMETDTVFGGCYRKEVFRKFGLFNEQLISTSDYEFNKRIKRGGARIFLDPGIRTIYYTRSSFSQFLKNNLRNGYWAIYPMAVTDHFPVSLRHLVPLFFLLGLIFLSVSAFLSDFFLTLLLISCSAYFLLSLYYTVRISGKKTAGTILLPFVFLSLHISYGAGSLAGLIVMIIKKSSSPFKSGI